MMGDVRTWVEIDARALRHNAEQFFNLIPADTRLMAVVKSNAYGHGLVQVAQQLAELRSKNYELGKRHSRQFKLSAHNSSFIIPHSRLWFGVDSITEATRLRREGIKNPVLVLGHTLPARMREAAEKNIILTISNFESLKALAGLRVLPRVHIKIDTGMHRQGFLPAHTPRLIRALKRFKIKPQGIYTHFASAKDPADLAYTRRQFFQFGRVLCDFEKAGFGRMIRHASASGGTLLFPEAHLDMVRVGMGLYGYWPSAETEKSKARIPHLKKITLEPVLSWKTVVGEIKEIPKGAPVGYDGTERMKSKTKIAVLPVGYWHGIDRGLSGIGEALIRGRRARFLGRVSMDMIVADITDISNARVGDDAVLIGRQGPDMLSAGDMAQKLGTTPYEILTRINPLIRRIVVRSSENFVS